MAGANALLIDLADAADEPVVGRVLQRMAGRAPPLFVVGSSGVEYALVVAWREAGLLPVMTAAPESHRALAEAAAMLLRAVLDQVPLRRFVVAGGDTSTAAIRHLGIEALEMVAPLFPGDPLGQALSPGHPLDGCEMMLKGGQMGSRDFFIQARTGRVS